MYNSRLRDKKVSLSLSKFLKMSKMKSLSDFCREYIHDKGHNDLVFVHSYYRKFPMRKE